MNKSECITSNTPTDSGLYRLGCWFVLVTMLFISRQSVMAQCPDALEVYQQVEEISADTDLKRMIAQLMQLNHTAVKCSIQNDSVRAKLLHVLGRTYWYVGDLKSGAFYTQQAIQFNGRLSKTAQRANLANSYYNLGRIVAQQTNPQQALRLFDQTIQIASNYPEKYTQAAKAYAQKADLHFYLGDYGQSQHDAEQGYVFARQANDRPQMIDNLIQQALAMVELKSYSTAEKSLLLALQLGQSINDSQLTAKTYSALAEYYMASGQYTAVVRYYQKAFSTSLKNNYREDCAKTLLNLGYFYRTTVKDYTRALALYKQAIPYIDNPTLRARLLDNIGYVYRLQKNYVQSLLYYQHGLVEISNDFKDSVVTLNPSAQTIRLVNEKEYLLTLIQDKADTWLDYAKETNNRQRFQYALATYKVADQMIDFMRWEHTGQQSKLFWREKTRGLYERAIETCYRLNDPEQAFRFFEKSRAVMLADKLNELGARQKLSQNQVDKENELRKAVNDQQTQLAGMSPDSDRYKSARMELFAKQEKLDAFLKQLEISNPDYYRYKYDTTITALADLRSRLNTQKASFVTYFVGDSALYVLGVTADGVKVLRQPVRGYQQAMNDFMSLLWNPEAMNRKSNFGKFLRSGHGLYQRLLAPLNLPAGRVIVSPDGSFVPFETLSRKATTPNYLVDNYAFSYNYSARLWLKKNDVNSLRNSFNQLDFLGVAPVDFAPSLKQVMLPGSDTALESIARRFNQSKLLIHKDATRREFLTQAADARVIHLCTHATADSSDQDEPKLYFADSTLQLSELSDRTLPNTQLVVLAACKTGIGANQRGEGVFSLARGFAALGVPSVLTTLWSVQNDATYQLTNLFYKHLDEGLSKDIALQLAKKEWLETADGANRLPNYWAGLIIVGDAEPLPNLHLALWGSFLALLLVAAGVIVWYERKKSRIKRTVSLPQPA